MDRSQGRDLDAATVRALELHELAAHATPGRVYRDLGDVALLSDPLDADPFMNRAVGVRFPAGRRAFDARLDELVVLFATLGRQPHVWSSPLGGSPADLPRRLLAAGFELDGERRLLALAGEPAGGLVRGLPAGVRLRRLASLAGDRAARAGEDAAGVLAAAFPGANPARVAAEVESSLTDPRRMLYLAGVETGAGRLPVAVVRRFTVDGLSYLSSIGTRPNWQGRGLGASLTAAAVADGAAAGAIMAYLAVEAGNEAAERLYVRLGFVPVGRPVGRFLAR